MEQLSTALPFRAELLRRRASKGLLDKGKVDGVAVEQVYEVVKKGRSVILNEGIGLAYAPEDVVGTLFINQVDEEVSVGTLSRSGFFDLIEAGDEVILQKKKDEQDTGNVTPDNPELRTLLRNMR
jgi:hypothetical protein